MKPEKQNKDREKSFKGKRLGIPLGPGKEKEQPELVIDYCTCMSSISALPSTKEALNEKGGKHHGNSSKRTWRLNRKKIYKAKRNGNVRFIL